MKRFFFFFYFDSVEFWWFVFEDYDVGVVVVVFFVDYCVFYDFVEVGYFMDVLNGFECIFFIVDWVVIEGYNLNFIEIFVNFNFLFFFVVFIYEYY